MNLSGGMSVVAILMQEATTRLCSEDIQRRLSEAVRKMFKNTESWGYLVAVFGDDQSGEVIYSQDSQLRKAPYTMSGTATTIEAAKSVNVVPFTTYEVQDEAVVATEAGARNSRRDLAQIQAIHNSAAALGAQCGKVREAHVSSETGALDIVERTAFPDAFEVVEAAKAALPIKLIAPCTGSTAHYTREALMRAATDRIFKAGTPMRIDHPTQAEESARPEGSVKDWGGVLATDAVWIENHAQGPGLYATVKPFSDADKTIREKGPFAGVSVRARGTAVMENGKPVLKDGKPVLERFTSAEGVDMVTRAGAGGLFLTESARTTPTNEGTMDEKAIQTLLNGFKESFQTSLKDVIKTEITAGIAAAIAPFRESALRSAATGVGTRLLGDMPFTEAQKDFVLQTALGRSFPVIEGSDALDEKKFGEIVTQEAKRYAATLGDGSIVAKIGTAVASQPNDPALLATQEAARDAALKVAEAEDLDSFSILMDNPEAAKLALKGRLN